MATPKTPKIGLFGAQTGAPQPAKPAIPAAPKPLVGAQNMSQFAQKARTMGPQAGQKMPPVGVQPPVGPKPAVPRLGVGYGVGAGFNAQMPNRPAGSHPRADAALARMQERRTARQAARAAAPPRGRLGPALGGPRFDIPPQPPAPGVRPGYADGGKAKKSPAPKKKR